MNYFVGQDETADEVLVGLDGDVDLKCTFSQNKKYGIKVFILADAKMHYCLNAIIYCGCASTEYLLQSSVY